MTHLLVDTSGLLCYHNRDDTQHQTAKQHLEAGGNRLVHSYILAEFTALAESRRLPREPALLFARDVLVLRGVHVVWVDEPLHLAALTLLDSRLDKTYSACDAVSFVLMRQLGITDALTTDRHFAQEGFVKLLD